MIIFLLVVFFLSSVLVAYSYVLYPMLLQMISKNKTQNQLTYLANELPDVAIFFAAYNEIKVIEEKLKSIIATSYPLEKLKVFIGSDNSTDGTNEVLAQYANLYPTLIFFQNFEGRNGKVRIINSMVSDYKKNKGNAALLVFTDANVMFIPDMFFHLAKHFKNKQIGQVGANVQNSNVRGEGISFQETAYIQRENEIKYQQGLHNGSMIGAFGACYAVRTELWQPVPENFLVDDFFTGMNVIKANRQSIFEKEAVCFEDVSNDAQVEFHRKRRMSAGNFQNLKVFAPLLFRFNAAAFHFFSHKVLRWLTPLFILLAFVASLALSFHFTLFIAVTSVFFLLICTPFWDKALDKLGIHIKLLRFVAYFVNMNVALIAGWLMYIKGIKSSVWTPTKRNI
jgi:cellulose synthase/poly-beta-1,6-N-acetylglucosamine synthase-like glycosyltransferase